MRDDSLNIFGAVCRAMRGQYLTESMTRPAQPYVPIWEQTDLFCPWCGVKGLQREVGEGDYYLGPKHHCQYCGEQCHLP